MTGHRGSEEQARGLVQFDLSVGIPDVAASVTSATLHFWIEQADGGQDVNIYRLTQEWVEGDRSEGSGATWNSYDGTNAWPGGAGILGDVATDGGEPIVYGNLAFGFIAENSVGVEVSTDVTDLVKSWLGGAPNYGMLLVTNPYHDFVRTFSKDATHDNHPGTEDVMPRLIINGLGGGCGPDIDGDGDVDDDDLSLLLANWGSETAGCSEGEFNGVPPVDDDDLSLLLANWTGSGAAAVPEPVAMVLVGLAAPVLLRYRRKA